MNQKTVVFFASLFKLKDEKDKKNVVLSSKTTFIPIKTYNFDVCPKI